MTQRAAIYARISRDRVGAGLGVERQEAECRAVAEHIGWTVATVHTDNDISASTGRKRPGYLALLEDVRAGRIDAVLAWHGDRLHRSPVELEHYITVCEPRSVPTHFVKAGPLDLTTATGRMTARITGAVARGEVEHMSERVKAQKARAAAAGEWTGGGRPFGYSRDGMELAPGEADVIRDGIHRVLAGESVYSISKQWKATVPPPHLTDARTALAEALDEHGQDSEHVVKAQRRLDRAVAGNGWTSVNVRRILMRPRNAGFKTHQGEVIGIGAFPAIVSEDEHRAVCALLGDPKRTTYAGVRSLKWLGSGLYLCGRCGASMRPGAVMNRDGTTRTSYRCRSANHLKINAQQVDEYIVKTVCTYLDREGPHLALVTNDKDMVRALQDEAVALRVRYAQLDDMFADGEIDRTGRARSRDRIDTKLAEIARQLDRRTTTPLSGVSDAEKPSVAFLSQPVARQRAIVDALLTVTIQPGRPGFQPHAGVDYDRVRIEWKASNA